MENSYKIFFLEFERRKILFWMKLLALVYLLVIQKIYKYSKQNFQWLVNEGL